MNWDGGSFIITEYGRDGAHGSGAGTMALSDKPQAAPENTSILVHTARHNTPFRRVPDSLPYS